jgi:DNA-binding NtrC family response regulator
MLSDISKLRELTDKLPKIPDLDIKVRVLVVENDERTRRLISSSLAFFGCSCKAVENGKEAMDDLDTHKYEVLLGHIVMSEEIGVGILRKFQEKNPKSMIVIVSGSDDHLKEYGKYLSILALPFGFYDLIKTNDGKLEIDDKVEVDVGITDK